jgi:ADP-heptose:LPS heptosyltransferase
LAERNILVIKLGALGDFVQAAGPFAAIRAHHPDARITLLTTQPFAEFARRAPWFDDVWIDIRPKLSRPREMLDLRRRLLSGNFARVYDLQTSDRSSGYRRLLWPSLFKHRPMPEWSGIAQGASHPHTNPKRDLMHTIERQKEQLATAGISDVRPPDFTWIIRSALRFWLPRPFALLVPGGSAHRPEKRWPVGHYSALATQIAHRGITPVVLGASSEKKIGDAICAVAPRGRNLAGETDLSDLFALARECEFAIGNDTGPMHITAAMSCPTVVLFSKASDPALCAPRGARVAVLRRDDLTQIRIDEVLAAIPSNGLRS